MCDLCSNDPAEHKRAQDNHRYMADRLESLAGYYRLLANGAIPPHSDKAKPVAIAARNMVRHLVEEWV